MVKVTQEAKLGACRLVGGSLTASRQTHPLCSDWVPELGLQLPTGALSSPV